MSYADVSLAASSSQAVSTPLYAGTNFNFGNGSRVGDIQSLENNPILPSTATSTKATGGNAISDTRVPITTDVPTTQIPFNYVPLAVGGLVLLAVWIAHKQLKLF